MSTATSIAKMPKNRFKELVSKSGSLKARELTELLSFKKTFVDSINNAKKASAQKVAV